MKATVIMTAIIALLSVVAVPLVWGDDDDARETWREYSRYSTGVALPRNPVYEKECGDCHMAYPPGLLPAVSWQKLMAGLEDHFGDNAELDAKTHGAILEFLLNHSADTSDYRRSRHFADIEHSAVVPLRISETPYFKHEHDEIPARLVTGNSEVGSFSNCNACHRRAEQGSFREQDINIPGYGRWDD